MGWVRNHQMDASRIIVIDPLTQTVVEDRPWIGCFRDFPLSFGLNEDGDSWAAKGHNCSDESIVLSSNRVCVSCFNFLRDSCNPA